MFLDYFGPKAFKFVFEHYLGHILGDKLSLDQLDIDFYHGTGEIKQIELDYQVKTKYISGVIVKFFVCMDILFLAA